MAAESFSYLVLLPAGLGVLGGFVSNYTLSTIQNSRGRWNKRAELICEILEKSAELGVEYWTKTREKIEDTKILEAKIIGAQFRLDGLMATFLRSCPIGNVENLRLKQIAVRNALTGGNFQSEPASDISRALEVQVSINDLIVEIQATSDAMVRPWRRTRSLIFRGKRVGRLGALWLSRIWQNRKLPAFIQRRLPKSK